MSNSSGRRAAIIDEIERRLKQIKKDNGYNLDVAVVQKRFPHLNQFLKENNNFIEGYIEDQNSTIPALLLQYGSLGSSTDRTETVGPNAYIQGQSRFANINQLEERLPIVIRGILRESETQVICDQKTISQINTDEITYEHPLVINKGYSSVPLDAQIEIQFFNLLDDGGSLEEGELQKTIKVTVIGEDDCGERVEDFFEIIPFTKILYNVSDEVPQEPSIAFIPEGEEEDRSSDFNWFQNNNVVEKYTSDWELIKPETIQDNEILYALYITRCQNKTIAKSSIFNLEGEFEINNPQIITKEIPLSDSTPDVNIDDKNSWPVQEQALLTANINTEYYVSIKWENDEQETIYGPSFTLYTDSQGNTDIITGNTEKINLVPFFTRQEINYTNLQTREKINSDTDTGNPNETIWSENIPDGEEALYATIAQIGSTHVYYIAPFRIATSALESKAPLYYRETTQKTFYKVTEIQVNGVMDPEKSSIKVTSSPIPLTTLVSQLHSDVQKAIYQNDNLLEVKNASGLIKELIDYGLLLNNQSSLSQSEKDLNFRERFITRVKSLAGNVQKENLPVTIDLGVSGVEDFIITDWYTFEGVWSPFEIIDFRLIVWHTYPKGSSV